MEVFVGLDWGEQHHQVHALDADGRTRLTLRVAHDRAGLDQLRVALAALGDPAVVGIAIERREGLLVEHLLAWGHPVYPVNPKVAARAREGYLAAPVKSDVLDAFALADLLRRQVTAWRPLGQASTTLAGIQALVRDRERFVTEHRRMQHQLRAVLLTYHPGVPHLFSTLHRGIALAFLRRFPTPTASAWLTVPRLARFLRHEGYTGRTDPAVLLARLRAHPVTPSDGTEVARARAALALADILERLTAIIADHDAAIAALVAQHPDARVFASLPGAGDVTVATLIAEIGENRDRFPHARKPARGGGARARHPAVGRLAPGRIPLRGQPPPPGHLAAVDADAHPGLTLDPRRLRRGTGPRAEPQPRRPLRRCPLGPDPLALLAGRGDLRPVARPPRPARGGRVTMEG